MKCFLLPLSQGPLRLPWKTWGDTLHKLLERQFKASGSWQSEYMVLWKKKSGTMFLDITGTEGEINLLTELFWALYMVLYWFFSPARQGSFSWLNTHIWLQLWSFWAGTPTQPPLQPWDQDCVMAFKDYWNSFLGAQLWSLSITSVLSLMTPSCWSFHSRWNGKKE